MSNTYNNTRRAFIANSGKALLALSLANVSKIVLAQNTTPKVLFKQTPLPYTYHALEACIDAKTMQIHYEKHAAAYLKNLNEAYAAELGAKEKSIEKILDKISKYSVKLRNNAGGHYNHEFFWQSLTPTSNNCQGNLLQAIEKQFGSFDKFKTAFTDAGKSVFGSGWVWLIKDKKNNLQITTTPNQDNPLMNVATKRGTPLLALDVWEHAYYLRYTNKRIDYINNFFKIVDWNKVEKRFVS